MDKRGSTSGPQTGPALEIALNEAGFSAGIDAREALSGGCIFRAQRITLTDGTSLVAKFGDAGARAQFEEEAAGLRALAETDTVIVPRALAVASGSDETVLLMTHIESSRASGRAWTRLGEDLARLHATDAGDRYGFDIDNHLGATPQKNKWSDDWARFNAVNRFGFQVQLARSRGVIGSREARDIERFIDRLPDLIPARPKPALLHGDLWSGNALPTLGERIAVIDPAPYVGDGWADIAMMRLFGGFPESCFDAYAAHVADAADADTRIAVYQAYHLLNHVNIFGRGYLGQTMAVIRRFAG